MSRLLQLDISADVLTQLETHKAPMRVQGSQNTYYILTADQIRTLVQQSATFKDDKTFAPEEFGLREEDVQGYLARRQQREQTIDRTQQLSLAPELETQLAMLRAVSFTSATLDEVNEETLEALEDLMLHNLQSAVQIT